MTFRFTLAMVISIFSTIPSSAQDDVDLFKYWSYYSDVENSLYKYFCSVAFDQLDERNAEIEKLNTKEDWLERQATVKRHMVEIVGSFPEKTPLNVQVTGVIQRKGYRVEKLIYESRPGYYVTSALFIPDNLTEKAPAILNPIGHSTNSFRRDIYQHTIINLVQKGFVVLAYDPVGQGERLQYYEVDLGESKFPSNHEHSYPGAQCFISGYSPAKYFIWDGIRGLDVLESRPEVDRERIGLTGISGGGTSTAQISVFDDRILAAAPECYITNFSYLFKSEGPQDSEQNLVKFIQRGLDHPDFIELRAPRPTLIMSTTRDFFSIQGALDSYKESGQAYAAFDASSNLQMTTDDDRHSFTKKNREAMYAFFQKHLKNPGDPTDHEVEVLSADQLQVTETGQVATSLKGETMYSLNKKIVEKQVLALESARSNTEEHISKVADAAHRISGFSFPVEFGSKVFSGRYIGEAYSIEKYLIQGSGDYMLPLVLCIPKENASKEVILLLHEKGKDFAMNNHDIAKYLLANGYSVLLTDLPDIGEMGTGYLRGDTFIGGVSYNKWFAGILTGKSIVGLRAEDILRIIKFTASDFSDYTTVSAISVGVLGSELLHAAAFKGQIQKLCLIEPFQSFSDIALSHEYNTAFIHSTVAGAIEAYDLPDLMAVFAPRKMLIVNPLKANGKLADQAVARQNLAFPFEVYLQKGKPKNIQLISTREEEIREHVLNWLKKED